MSSLGDGITHHSVQADRSQDQCKTREELSVWPLRVRASGGAGLNTRIIRLTGEGDYKNKVAYDSRGVIPTRPPHGLFGTIPLSFYQA